MLTICMRFTAEALKVSYTVNQDQPGQVLGAQRTSNDTHDHTEKQ